MLTEIMAVLESGGSNEEKAREILRAITKTCEPTAWIYHQIGIIEASPRNERQMSALYLDGKVDPLFRSAPVRVRELEDMLLWALYHHQGGASHIGQPIRRVLGIGQYDELTPVQIDRGKAAALYAVTDTEHAQSHRSCACDGLSYKEA